MSRQDDVGLNSGSAAFPPVDDGESHDTVKLKLSHVQAQTLLFALRRISGEPEKSRMVHLAPIRDKLMRKLGIRDEGDYRQRLWHGGRTYNLFDGVLSCVTEDARARSPVADRGRLDEATEPVVVEDADFND